MYHRMTSSVLSKTKAIDESRLMVHQFLKIYRDLGLKPDKNYYNFNCTLSGACQTYWNTPMFKKETNCPCVIIDMNIELTDITDD